jgi:hypothetical protein
MSQAFLLLLSSVVLSAGAADLSSGLLGPVRLVD